MTATVPIAWLIARAAGLVAFGLLTLSVWLGLSMSTRLIPPKWTKRLLGLHRTLAWTGLSMIGLHISALLLDPVMHFGALALLVPGAATYRPTAVALGVVAAWLTLALAASFNARRWIGQKGWRRLHYATFAAFWLALGHALLVGTDLRGSAARSPRSWPRLPYSGSPSTGSSSRGPHRLVELPSQSRRRLSKFGTTLSRSA